MHNNIDDSIFECCINRRKTDSVKWDLHPETTPAWIADMDFQSPACVIDVLKDRVEHGVFGYTLPPDDMADVLVSYMKRNHSADIDPSWILHMGGCVPALSTSVMAVCDPGDSVMCCTPVYPPIRHAHAHGKCESIEVPHIFRAGEWLFDWDAMEEAVRPDTKMFILCNPQNPLGKVLSREEVLRVADFCERHDLILCSDEIHCDLMMDTSVTHETAVSLPERYLKRTIMMTAPSKTYNIAGIGYTMVVIPSPELRKKFDRTRDHLQPSIHCFAYLSARAAYSQGEPWRNALLAYLRKNCETLYAFVSDRMPDIRMVPMQATYLAWLDCSALGLSNPQEFFIEKAGVFLNDGADFGSPQCVRFNFGTQRSSMLDALERMATAVETLRV